MELAELLDREGLAPDVLMPWARERAAALVAELAEQVSPEHELLRLLEGSGRLEPLEALIATTEPEPVSVAELPPPPEQLSDGEPEPLLETFDTRPILLGEPDEPSEDEVTRVGLVPGLSARGRPDQADQETRIERSPQDDTLEEIELDELVEIDDAELEMLEDDDESSDDESVPVRSGDTASGLPILDDSSDPDAPTGPIQTGQTASFAAIPVQSGGTAAHPTIPVQTGDTAKHATIDEPIADDEDDEDVD